MEHLNLLLFDQFETLDLFGPVEIFGRVAEWNMRFISVSGGVVRSRQGAAVLTEDLSAFKRGGALFLPGGMGTRTLVENGAFLEELRGLAEASAWVMTVCTGSALLAKTGLLDGRRATSNKRSFEWVRSTGPHVQWQPKARWVADGAFYTSSGVSAGMDMALAFVADRLGVEKARQSAREIEYLWNDNPAEDPFAVL